MADKTDLVEWLAEALRANGGPRLHNRGLQARVEHARGGSPAVGRSLLHVAVRYSMGGVSSSEGGADEAGVRVAEGHLGIGRLMRSHVPAAAALHRASCWPVADARRDSCVPAGSPVPGRQASRGPRSSAAT